MSHDDKPVSRNPLKALIEAAPRWYGTSAESNGPALDAKTTTERFVLAYSVTRDRWFVEDRETDERRTFRTRDAALRALDKANAS